MPLSGTKFNDRFLKSQEDESPTKTKPHKGMRKGKLTPTSLEDLLIYLDLEIMLCPNHK